MKWSLLLFCASLPAIAILGSAETNTSRALDDPQSVTLHLATTVEDVAGIQGTIFFDASRSASAPPPGFPPVSLHRITKSAGIPCLTSESGDLTFTDLRPPLSSMRFSVEPTQECLDAFGGRSAVVRVTNPTGEVYAYIHICGDKAGAEFVPNTPVEMAVLHQPMDTSQVIEDIAAHKSYRFILVNANTWANFSPSIRIVFPTVASLQPSSGKRTGGYTVNVSGKGFGQNARILLSGEPVTITYQTDTLIEFTMPAVGDSTASWNLSVLTEEGVSTNARVFTFTD